MGSPARRVEWSFTGGPPAARPAGGGERGRPRPYLSPVLHLESTGNPVVQDWEKLWACHPTGMDHWQGHETLPISPSKAVVAFVNMCGLRNVDPVALTMSSRIPYTYDDENANEPDLTIRTAVLMTSNLAHSEINELCLDVQNYVHVNVASVRVNGEAEEGLSNLEVKVQLHVGNQKAHTNPKKFHNGFAEIRSPHIFGVKNSDRVMRIGLWECPRTGVSNSDTLIGGFAVSLESINHNDLKDIWFSVSPEFEVRLKFILVSINPKISLDKIRELWNQVKKSNAGKSLDTEGSGDLVSGLDYLPILPQGPKSSASGARPNMSQSEDVASGQTQSSGPTISATHLLEYAMFLGLELPSDTDLLYIAEEALKQPLPSEWSMHLDNNGNEYYYNNVTDDSTWFHPNDHYYINLVKRLKDEKKQDKEIEENRSRRRGSKTGLFSLDEDEVVTIKRPTTAQSNPNQGIKRERPLTASSARNKVRPHSAVGYLRNRINPKDAKSLNEVNQRITRTLRDLSIDLQQNKWVQMRDDEGMESRLDSHRDDTKKLISNVRKQVNYSKRVQHHRDKL